MNLKDTSTLARLTGHIGFLFLIAMSAILANERVIFIDSAAQLFEMIQRDGFVIFDHRYTMAVTQSLPLLMIKLGLPLQAIIIGYSVAAPLLGYLLFLLIVYRMRDIRLGLLMLCGMLCLRHTFFHGISETFSLFFYATLLLALLRHRPTEGPWRIALHTAYVSLCTVACVFMHPIGMFFVLFLLGYHLVDRHWHITPQMVAGALFLLVASVVKIMLGSDHDSTFMPSFYDVIFCLKHPDKITIFQSFYSRLLDLYLFPLALYAITLVFHWRRREWQRLTYSLLFNGLFLLMTIIVYRWEDSDVGIERSFLPIMFFASVPFVCEVLPAASDRVHRITLLLFSLALMLSYGKIAYTSRHYTQRLDKLEEIASEGRRQGLHKMVTDEQSLKRVVDIQSWATSFESMLVSSLHGPRNTVNIYAEIEPVQADNPDYRLADVYLGVPWWRLWYYNSLRPQWFSLPQQTYCLLTFDEKSAPVLSTL